MSETSVVLDNNHHNNNKDPNDDDDATMTKIDIENKIDIETIKEVLDEQNTYGNISGEGYENGEDLEDGEIDDDDDNDDNAVSIVQAELPNTAQSKSAKALSNDAQKHLQNDSNKNCTEDELSSTKPSITSPSQNVSSTATASTKTPATGKSKTKQQPVEDDHASSIENAIASALKKKGIEPSMPKGLESRSTLPVDSSDMSTTAHSQSRSCRRRKRKKQRDEKDRKDKKKRFDSPDQARLPSLDDDEEMDEYEMMNVRGGSPPPMPHTSSSTLIPPLHYKEQYDSHSETGSSYESYEDYEAADGAGSNNRRRRKDKRGDNRKRRNDRTARNHDDERGQRKDKRIRRDSVDEKHRQEPRKMELCKFYLMECCAKKDKCSYMHADFPCKYYYLGMECTLNEECKFSHGEPMTEQLRNILLKHLETAPKEILGNFKRVSRETAISQMTQRHEELCKKFGVENSWTSISNVPTNFSRRSGDQQMQQHQHQLQQQQQQQSQQNSSSSSHPTIPSLFDIVIKPPLELINNQKMEREKRKSRWTESNRNVPTMPAPVEPAPAPKIKFRSQLDLRNLDGVLSAEHISKLTELGIVNLEEVNQLTLVQINQIGLTTIAEISGVLEKLLNPKSARTARATASAEVPDKQQTNESEKQPNKTGKDDSIVPVSLPVAAAATATATSTNADVDAGSGIRVEKDVTTSSNSNSNSSSAVVMVDYSQYLKDSNLTFDRNDAFDDVKDDDDELVIDDGNTDNEENNIAKKTTEYEPSLGRVNEEKKDTFFGLQTDSIAFKNPFSSLQNFTSGIGSTGHQRDPRDPRSGAAKDQTNKHRNPFATHPDEDNNSDSGNDRYDNDAFFSSFNRFVNNKRRSRSRSRSHTPTRSQSTTPEASQSPEPALDNIAPAELVYDRSTMYDYKASQAQQEDELRDQKNKKADKDMRFLHGGADGGAFSDIDLRLPFQPVTNYTPATEIDGSINSHLPIQYKVYVVETPQTSYAELRQNFKSDHTSDPRMRRILGLPELSQTKTSAALGRTVRKLSNTIASPESEGASPKYYTPPSSLTEEREKKPVTSSQPRLDPRRAAAASANKNSSSSSNTSDTLHLQVTGGNANEVSNSAASQISTNALKQNNEIRKLLQTSEWYKNLNSKFKIIVNQQLALISTELKRFHNDTRANKTFDIGLILNNKTLEQILTHLGIYIDENGEVKQVEVDSEEQEAGGDGGSTSTGITLPNLSQPPPQQSQQQLDFLRAPPPNMTANAISQMFRTNANGPMAVQLNMPGFNGIAPPTHTRPSLLGLPPGTPNNPFNPFARNNMPDMGMNPNFMGGGGGPGGPMVPMGFGNFCPPNMQQRNFMMGSNNQRNMQRNQQNRRKI